MIRYLVIRCLHIKHGSSSCPLSSLFTKVFFFSLEVAGDYGLGSDCLITI